jgi:phage terminase large subunit-like protein
MTGKPEEGHATDLPESSTGSSSGLSDLWTPKLAKARAALGLIEASPEDRELEERIRADWSLWAGPGQDPPDDPRWRVWLFMGGRGAGKTRAGAEWVRGEVLALRARRIGLIGKTLGDVREVMIEGPSGLRSIGLADERPTYSPTRRRLEWPNGAEAYAFSSEAPEALRGPQFDAVWCDEVGAWSRGERTWDTMVFTLRLGRHPRIAATTTPRPTGLVRRLLRMVERGSAQLTRARSADNAAFLAPGFVEMLEEMYGGSDLARQELEGEFVDEIAGAMFRRSVIDINRVSPAEAQPLDRVVVAVDPAASTGPTSSACGIIVAGVRAGMVYVLEDASAKGLAPADWASRAVSAARRWGAERLLAEANQGGDMVRDVLAQAGGHPREGLRVDLVRARANKVTRASPVSALYDRGRVRHAGVFRDLEDELCAFGSGDEPGMDRVDALVWAVSDLMAPRPSPGARAL